MKRERRGGGGGPEEEEEEEGGTKREGRRGNTGTSHELNSQQQYERGPGDGGGRGEAEGTGGALLHYATHTYTHTKETGHKLHFPAQS